MGAYARLLTTSSCAARAAYAQKAAAKWTASVVVSFRSLLSLCRGAERNTRGVGIFVTACLARDVMYEGRAWWRCS